MRKMEVLQELYGQVEEEQMKLSEGREEATRRVFFE